LREGGKADAATSSYHLPSWEDNPILTERFWEKISKDEHGCWLWTAGRNSCGYGLFWYNGHYELAHRVSYSEHRGEIPEGLQIDHLCRVRSCVCPDHLEIVTSRENTMRGVGISADNHRKTICPRGHAFEFRLNGRRFCRVCSNRQRRYRRLLRKRAVEL
jgi:hypothetical protein